MGLFRRTVDKAVTAATDTVKGKVADKLTTDILPTLGAVLPFAGIFLPLLKGSPTDTGIHIHDCHNCNITIIRK